MDTTTVFVGHLWVSLSWEFNTAYDDNDMTFQSNDLKSSWSLQWLFQKWLKGNKLQETNIFRLVVYLPLWKIWFRQLGLWHSQHDGKVIKFHGSKPPSRYIVIPIMNHRFTIDSPGKNVPNHQYLTSTTFKAIIPHESSTLTLNHPLGISRIVKTTSTIPTNTSPLLSA